MATIEFGVRVYERCGRSPRLQGVAARIGSARHAQFREAQENHAGHLDSTKRKPTVSGDVKRLVDKRGFTWGLD